METEFNKKRVAEITGLTERQIQFYTENGIVTPEVDPGMGRGKRRLYSHDNLFQFSIIKELTSFGIPISKLKFIFDLLETRTLYRECQKIIESDPELQVFVKVFYSDVFDKFSVTYLSLRDSDIVLKVSEMKHITNCFVINLREIYFSLKRHF
ncbi:MAG TPA: hypothetical protein DCR95_12120 [Desulfobacter sp.]|uniref:MerR family transcriptional regulator n=1 Tax=Desulfobacter sp. UBA2225 TaxID=1961413 RepID=UPI000E975C7B|nr:MerR family transcriptional regulator [Desulfobacter sp. UBA2225]HAR34794.1 hypothetical protein [Desulfobacter sp.]